MIEPYVDTEGRPKRPFTQMVAPDEEHDASGGHDDESYHSHQHGGRLLPCIQPTLRRHVPSQKGTSANGLAEPQAVIGIPARDFTDVFDESLSREYQEEKQRDTHHQQADDAVNGGRIARPGRGLFAFVARRQPRDERREEQHHIRPMADPLDRDPAVDPIPWHVSTPDDLVSFS